MSPGNENYGYNGGTDLAKAKYGISFPELCADFLSAFSRTAKSAALYTLTHPMVTESLGRAYAVLGEVIDSEGGEPLVLSFQHDVWMFNDNPVPVVGQDSINLVQMFKTRGLHGIRFETGVRVSELAIVCEYLSSGGRGGQQALPFNSFLKAKGVANVHSEEAQYVRESAYRRQAEEPPDTKAVKPRPAASSPAPELTPRPPATAARAASVPARPQERPAPAPQPKSPQEAAAGQGIPAAEVKVSGGQGRGSGTGGAGGGAGQGKGSGTGGAGGGAGQGKGSGTGGAGGGAGQGTGDGGSAGGQGGEAQGILGGMTLGSLLSNLVESAVKDPNERVKMYQDAMRMLKDGMSRQIAQATTELAKEKAQMQNAITRTEHVLAHVAEGKVVVDKDGRILMMNSAAEEISGRRLFEVVGKHVTEHLNPEEHILTISKDMDLSADKVPTGEVSVTGDETVGGALRRSMALLEDSDGRVIGAYMTLPEVTKFKEAQKLQDEFLSRVTHDLQSPLASISSALEMLTESAGQKLDEDENSFLAISMRNSRRLAEMIRGILDFSKLQAGKMSVHPEPTDLCPIINEAVDGLTPWARSKGLSLVLKSCAPNVRVIADHQRIVQVLTNLISNAVKSTPSGGSIMVAAARAATPDQSVVIGVRDTGSGIPKEDLDKIFERFVQLDEGGKREGVGLGLSIVKEFISLHKGRIWAESQEGKGTTFYFTLPMAPPGT